MSGPQLQTFSAHLELGDDGAKWKSSCTSQKDEDIAKVKELSGQGFSVREIADKTGISKSKVQRLKEEAAAA